MKKINVLLILAAIVATPLAAQQRESAGINLNMPVDSACYAIGVNYGSGLRESMNSFPGGNVNYNALAEGFINAFLGNNDALLITAEEALNYIQAYIMDVTNKEAEAAKEEEMRFFAENKSREDVITTESGLQYKVLKQGEGAKPTAEDRVTVHYTGQFLDGTVFESSEEQGEPVTFGVSQVIDGWTEVLQLMPAGARYLVWIPSQLGYGEQGAGQIGPNSTLVFEMELLEIEE